MMDSILFLHEHSSYKIEKQVFKDFNMLDMLGDDIVAVLSIPCNEDEILERQNIFKDLYDENFYNNKKCISLVRICLQTRKARNASTKFRKTSESKKAEKSLEISVFLVFSCLHLNQTLIM